MKAESILLPSDCKQTRVRQLELYRFMYTARQVDECEKRLVSQNLGHFHLSGSGHEATAVLAAHLTTDDWLLPHYRDRALLLARGLRIEDFFRNLFCKSTSASSGRQMNSHLSALELRIPSMPVPVGNHALHAAGIAAAVKNQHQCPIVVCGLGDGGTQEGEVLEAIAEAVRWTLPVLFLIENNHWSISTRTQGKTFFELPSGSALEFYGRQIQRLDGTDVIRLDSQLHSAVSEMRLSREPQIVVLDMARLGSHSNADDQSLYRASEDIESCKKHHDPISRLRLHLLDSGYSSSDLSNLEETVRESVDNAVATASLESEPVPCFTAKAPPSSEMRHRVEYRGDNSTPRLNMREAICGVLRARLATDQRVVLYGQDIEDPKGDVFGVTRGLSFDFPNRVLNAPLSESTIVGSAIGRALAGQRPVAFIQFADFLPLALNQILSELSSIYWRTNGRWQAPVIVMVSCGGYRPGLGPFHSQTMDGLLSHVPGIDVLIPSTAADAAGLLNAAFDSNRPTVFLYPKSCLNVDARACSADVSEHFVQPGTARRLTSGSDLTLVTWGNPVAQCEFAVKSLEQPGFTVDFFDLRSLSPWDQNAVITSVQRTRRLVVVHEDNMSGGFGAEIVATVVEHIPTAVRVRRIARPDTFVPFHPGNQRDLLPSKRAILETCASVLDCEVEWEQSLPDLPGTLKIVATGTGPSDDAVDVVKIHVSVGDTVEAGQIIMEGEATKSIGEICSPVRGRITEIPVSEGARVSVGSTIAVLETESTVMSPRAVELFDNPGIPHIRRSQRSTRATPGVRSAAPVGIAQICGVTGSRIVSNSELAERWPNRSVEEIVKRTGIVERRWIGRGQSVLSLATDATRQLLDLARLTIYEIDLVIACTTTPDKVTPSLACRVAASLATRDMSPALTAYDINAACSAYLYALAQAWDFLQLRPSARVLIITSEVLSPLLDPADFDTAILFGDAATATLVLGDSHNSELLYIDRPVTSGLPDRQSALQVPFEGRGYLEMLGGQVFRQAVLSMTQSLRRACDESCVAVEDLGLIIPHQANRRILKSVEERVGRPVLCTLMQTGNTSSSSIPLALVHSRNECLLPQYFGLCAFGGGMTTAACVGRTNTPFTLKPQGIRNVQ